jgi:hypothetical protein
MIIYGRLAKPVLRNALLPWSSISEEANPEKISLLGKKFIKQTQDCV